MKVLVVNNMAPFVWGGAEELAANLTRELIVAGHQAELVRLPFQWEPATRIPSQMALARGIVLDGVDRVIALKFPAYLLEHPDKAIWLIHQYRQAYDLDEVGRGNLPAGSDGSAIREMIRRADHQAMTSCRSLFSISHEVTRRLRRGLGLEAEVLVPPLGDSERFVPGADDGYIFAAGRINSMKRQDLLLEAMVHAPRARLVVAGPPDTREDGDRLEAAAERLGLGHRVTIDARMLTRDDYAGLVRGARAVATIPFQEDSLSFVVMEAATARKPIITTADSGGVRDLVRDGETGWVVEPTPQALGEALTEASVDSRVAAHRGAAAAAALDSLGVNWQRTVEALLR